MLLAAGQLANGPHCSSSGMLRCQPVSVGAAEKVQRAATAAELTKRPRHWQQCAASIMTLQVDSDSLNGTYYNHPSWRMRLLHNIEHGYYVCQNYYNRKWAVELPPNDVTYGLRDNNCIVIALVRWRFYFWLWAMSLLCITLYLVPYCVFNTRLFLTRMPSVVWCCSSPGWRLSLATSANSRSCSPTSV